MSRRDTTHRRDGGFTLLESVATITVLVAIGSVGSLIVLTAVDGYGDAAVSAQLHAEASGAMSRITRELRRIGRDGAAADVAPHIDSVTPNSISWRDADGEPCSLALSGSDLMLAVDGGAAERLLSDAAAFEVRAFDEDNAVLADELSGAACDPIRRLSVTITLQRAGVTESLRSRVFLRSTMAGAGAGGGA